MEPWQVLIIAINYLHMVLKESSLKAYYAVKSSEENRILIFEGYRCICDFICLSLSIGELLEQIETCINYVDICR